MKKPSILKVSNNLKEADSDQLSSMGFSIIEALTAIFIFSLIAIVATVIMVEAMRIERRALAAQVVQENALAVFELMAKEIRVSRVADQESNCSISIQTPRTSLTVEHPLNGNIIFQRGSDGRVERIIGGTRYIISSEDVLFNSLGFCVLGSISPSDDKSPRVTIIASISNRSGSEFLTVNLQTTVTSRDVSDEGLE